MARGEKAEDLDDFIKSQLYINISHDARKELYKRYSIQKQKLLLQLGKAEPQLQNIYNEVQQLKEQYDTSTGRKDSNIIFATLSPRNDVPFKIFKDAIEKIKTKVWMKKYLQVYEQRGQDVKDIHGFHAHFIIYRDGKKFSDIKRELFNTFKKLYDEEVYSAFDIKLVPDDEANVKRLFNYLIGKKKDEIKQKKQAIDLIWREQQKLKSYYSVGIDAETLQQAEVQELSLE